MTAKSGQNIIFSATLEHLDYVIGDAPFGLLSLNTRGFITMINKQVIEMLSLPYSMEDIIGREFYGLLSEFPELQNAIHNMINARISPSFIDSIHTGSRQLVVRSKSIKGGYIVSVQNITALMDTEKETIAAVIQGLEQERERIAGEIHDGVGPMLAAIKMNLEAIMARNASQLDRQSVDEWKGMVSALDETMRDLRAISHELLPGVISDFGLIQAIKSLCSKIDGRRGMGIHFYSNLEKRLAPEYELSIYRIIQELTNNAIKHSDAENLSIQLLDHQDSLVLIVEDNGKGWDMNDPDLMMTGIGLRNIKGRVKALGGSLIFDTQPGKGLSTIIEFPRNSNEYEKP